jgi:hypothetical protein
MMNFSLHAFGHTISITSDFFHTRGQATKRFRRISWRKYSRSGEDLSEITQRIILSGVRDKNMILKRVLKEVTTPDCLTDDLIGWEEMDRRILKTIRAELVRK